MMKSAPKHFVQGQDKDALCGFVLSARSQTTNNRKDMTCKACITAYMHSRGFTDYQPSTHREDRDP